jgi:tRNA U34 5-carboxymethylaminomethyl modifying enzyme MnmG/GidA
MNPYERACKEFLKGCSNTTTGYPERCPDCLNAFINAIKHINKVQKCVPINKESKND